MKNVNQASSIINLLTDLHPDPGPVSVIYELLDLSKGAYSAGTRGKRKTKNRATAVA